MVELFITHAYIKTSCGKTSTECSSIIYYSNYQSDKSLTMFTFIIALLFLMEVVNCAGKNIFLANVQFYKTSVRLKRKENCELPRNPSTIIFIFILVAVLGTWSFMSLYIL